MKKRKIKISKRNKIYLVVSAIMILVGYPAGSTFLMLLGTGIQFFIWLDLLADNLTLKPE